MKNLLLLLLIFTMACSSDSSTEVTSPSPFMKASYALPVVNRSIHLRITTLNGQNLVNDNEVNVIDSGIVSISRDGLPTDPNIWIRDMGTDVMELTVKIDAVNLQKLITCASSQ